MSENVEKKENLDEEPVHISNFFFIKVLGYGIGLAAIIIGIPFVIYSITH